MNTRTEIPENEPVIVMKRTYEAPRDLVWQAITDARHVRKWWGGAGVSNPVCEMDVRPGGLWTHVMRFPDGRELHMSFVFIEVEKPARLAWRSTDSGTVQKGPPGAAVTVMLEALGSQTEWTMVARFQSFSDREAALAIGFTKPIEASSDRLVEYLKTM
ncbi:SRPBCC domain-containing protein [Mesorhizobium sp. BAC0120]|uniref:SRPBCC domain-containing protein n=1 Tax=Mesorhizobium sp. BAC0120 TaxID=3090670 RepID=UPI00298CA022|nr:SRPBCC domain-containing protein [Mesorhizobium sp. BAC0120]MDW6022946.1 SRPBCC domain-containing protein [Mesorhizobium sp. BAC0120]